MDIQFLQFSDVLDVSQAEEIPDLVPRTIRIIGLDLNKAVEVQINEESSPSFVVVNSNTIVAQVPSGQLYNTIKEISVISSEFTATFRSQLSFQFGKDPKKISGLKVMMQTFLKVLFTTPGIDSFNKSLGGGALNIVGDSISDDANQGLVANFAIAVSRTVEQIRALQARQLKLLDDERLLSAEVLGLRYDPVTTTLVARIELIAQSGLRAISNLEL
jgi:hypothetical protein